tara:strand:- start:49 stop:453 length:405 start_codon:yes stop_codon:yes gene_type:complete
MGVNMDMSDPRWPSLREAARRFLRVDSCRLSVPKEFVNNAWDLIQLISDNVPAKTGLPSVIEGPLSIEGLAHFGSDEPSLEVCWVPNTDWYEFEDQVKFLLEAGYPGCAGCGGETSESEWNESSRRTIFQQEKY